MPQKKAEFDAHSIFDVFQSIDVEMRGYITQADLARVVPTAGEVQLKQIMDSLDSTGDGKIRFADFKKNFKAFAKSMEEERKQPPPPQSFQDDLIDDIEDELENSKPRTLSDLPSPTSDLLDNGDMPAFRSRRNSTMSDATNPIGADWMKPSSPKATATRARRPSVASESSAQLDDNPERDLFKRGKKMLLLNAGDSKESSDLVGELLQRNQILESKMRQLNDERKKKKTLAMELEQQASLVQKKDDEIRRLQELAKSLENRMQSMTQAASATIEKNKKLVTTLETKLTEEEKMKVALKDTEDKLKLILDRRKMDEKKQKELEEKAMAAARDAELARKAAAKAATDAKKAREAANAKLPASQQVPTPKMATIKEANEDKKKGLRAEDDRKMGESLSPRRFDPSEQQVLMIKDTNTGKMVPISSVQAKVDHALVLGNRQSNPLSSEDFARESFVRENGKDKALWASEDPTLTVLPPTHMSYEKLHFDRREKPKPGRVKVSENKGAFSCTFRNTHRIGVRMNGNGAFFHVYMDGKLSKGFATSRYPGDYELYTGISGKKHTLKVSRSDQPSTMKYFEVYGVIVETTGVVTKLDGRNIGTQIKQIAPSQRTDWRSGARTPPPRSRMPTTVNITMDNTPLGIHHKHLVISKLSDRGQARRRGVQIGWKLIEVGGQRLFNAQLLKIALKRSRSTGKGFVVKFEIPVGEIVPAHLLSPHRAKRDSFFGRMMARLTWRSPTPTPPIVRTGGGTPQARGKQKNQLINWKVPIIRASNASNNQQWTVSRSPKSKNTILNMIETNYESRNKIFSRSPRSRVPQRSQSTTRGRRQTPLYFTQNAKITPAPPNRPAPILVVTNDRNRFLRHSSSPRLYSTQSRQSISPRYSRSSSFRGMH